MSASPDCLICKQEQIDPSLTVFTDDDWAAGIIEGFDVPGWIVLRIRRHAIGLPSLDAREQASFGRRASDLISAVKAVTGSVATYMMIFGEANPHFHALITPRTADVPADRRTGDILKLRQDHADLAAARARVPQIRAAYEALAKEQRK
jgi:diadenosine tetraphosphate (Ap4A) HIT family hydrolase